MLPVNEKYTVTGKIQSKGVSAADTRVRIEIWDSKISGLDIIGSVVSDSKSSFQISFDDQHLNNLGLGPSPSIFVKAFVDEELVYTGEDRKPRRLKPGKNSISINLDDRVGVAKDALLVLTASREIPVYDKPDGKQTGCINSGEVFSVQSVLQNGYSLTSAGKTKGWVDFADLDSLAHYLDDYIGSPDDLEIFPRTIRSKLENTNFSEDIGKQMDCLLANADLLNELGQFSRGAQHYNPTEMNRFDTMLDLLIDRFQPPSRAKNFSLLAMRHEIDTSRAGLGIPNLNRTFKLPCLLNLRGIHLLGTSVFRSAWRLFQGDPEGMNQRLWDGLFVLGKLLTEANLAGAISQQIDQGGFKFVRNTLKAADCSGFSGQNFEPISGQFSQALGWEPGSFPGFPRLPRFDCRVEQWERSARAVRCCGQVYRINEISGGNCPGDVITIVGEGFSHVRPTINSETGEEEYPPDVDPRIWPFPHDPGPLPPGAIPGLTGPPGPFENLVYFPDGDGGFIAAREYREWLYDRVQVVVPEGARSGAVEMRIICDRTFIETPTDLNRCGLETRLPAHDPARAFHDIHIGTLRIDARDWRGERVARIDLPGVSETRTEVAAGGCRDFDFIVSGTNLVSLRVSVRDGTTTNIPVGTAGGVADLAPTTISVPDANGEDQFVTITGTDGCGNEMTHDFRLYRTPAINVTVPPGPHDPRTTTSIPVSIELSCHPDDLDLNGRTDLPVNARVNDLSGSRQGGIDLAETRFSFTDRGPQTTQITLASPFISHGQIQVRASEQRSLSPPPPRHSPGIANFNIAVGAFAGRFTGTGIIDLMPPTGRMLPDLLSSPPPYGTGTTPLVIPLNFDAFGTRDRPNSRVTLATASLDFGGVELRLVGGGVGTFNCSDFSINIPVVAEMGIGIESVRIDMNFTTGMAATTLFAPASGSPVDNTGAVTLVGAGVIGGGGPILDGFNGVEVLVTLTGTIA